MRAGVSTIEGPHHSPSGSSYIPSDRRAPSQLPSAGRSGGTSLIESQFRSRRSRSEGAWIAKQTLGRFGFTHSL